MSCYLKSPLAHEHIHTRFSPLLPPPLPLFFPSPPKKTKEKEQRGQNDRNERGKKKTHRLQSLLVRLAKRAALERDDGRRGLGVVGDGRPALGAEDAVDGLARGAVLGEALGRARDGQLVLGDDDYEGCFFFFRKLC